MFKPYHFEKPLGMRDLLPAQFAEYREIRNKLEEEMKIWGYPFVATPTLEYYDTVGQASAILEQQLFKLLDREGRTVVLRPDMTSPIARVVASGLKQQSLPIRLAYTSALFRAQQYEAGRPAEFDQTGVELIGDPTPQADAEVIALMIHLLQTVELDSIHVSIGHIGFVNALLLDILGNEGRAAELKHFLYQKNDVGFTQHVQSLNLSSIDEERLLNLLTYRGLKSNEAREAIRQALPANKAQGYEEELGDLWRTLEAYGVIENISLDLSLVNHLNYYTGVVFEGFGGQIGFGISSGGRYDQLLSKFGRQAPATGFGIRLDRLFEALDRDGNQGVQVVEAVIYSQERFQEALIHANQLRQAHKSVVLQNIKGIEDIDTFTKQFGEVTYFVGAKGRGN